MNHVSTILNERYLVPSFYVFFLIYSNIIGIGIMSFQRDITKDAGYDAWISIILSSLSIHIVVWMIYRILGITKNDVIHVHEFCFGKWIGGLFNIFVIFYFLVLALIVFRVYIVVVQVWLFPLMKTWQISLILLVLIYYIVSGGFRVITGMCFWGTIIPFIILFPLNFFSLEFANFNHLLPIFNHSVKEIVSSSKNMLFQYVGFETLFMFYPFIKNPERSQKWAHFGLLFSSLLYLIIALITFVFFSEGHLNHTIWPTITQMKIAKFPLIERVEFIVVSIWLLLVLPNISVKIWAGCRGIKKLVNVKQRISLFIVLVLFFIIANVLKEKIQIERLNEIYSNIAFYFVYLYIPFLFFYIHIKHKITK
ncbi:GerAB/ArcD/ProY family transporter [Peribacillus sp. R9-11]|uniref:GerAB/ArcD/ProY family transporter n=1 Tax=Peribacillus sp. R9-11 TaxID=3073271 RepID=UPI0028696272|nr:GerAB/ArcD/ProY family transporter [Peribacillus sp. R9-11]WMX58777.1 GerAB/ArcD/ProY family transporter [Peribacillus sp. R9-11]